MNEHLRHIVTALLMVEALLLAAQTSDSPWRWA